MDCLVIGSCLVFLRVDFGFWGCVIVVFWVLWCFPVGLVVVYCCLVVIVGFIGALRGGFKCCDCCLDVAGMVCFVCNVVLMICG